MVGAKPNRPKKGKFRPRENSDKQRPRAHTTEECQNASDAKTEGLNRPSSTSTTSMNPLCEKIAEKKRGAGSSQLRPPITPNEWARQYCTETPAVPSCTLRTLAAPSATLFGYNHNSPSSATPSLSLLQCISGISTPAALTSAKAGEASLDPMTSRCMTACHDRTRGPDCTVLYRTAPKVQSCRGGGYRDLECHPRRGKWFSTQPLPRIGRHHLDLFSFRVISRSRWAGKSGRGGFGVNWPKRGSASS